MPLLPHLGHALTGLASDVEIVAVLQSVGTLPVLMRAEVLRTFACRSQVPGIYTADSLSRVNEQGVWRAVIDETRAVLRNVCDASERVRHDVDLDIAAIHTFEAVGCTEEALFCNALSARLKTYPVQYWPELLDALVVCGRPSAVPNMALMLGDGSTHFSGISDALALAFAGSRALLSRGPTQQVLRSHFGVTEAQYARALQLPEAIELAEWRVANNVSFPALWTLTTDVEQNVVELSERVGFEASVAPAFENGRRWSELVPLCRSVFGSVNESVLRFLDKSGVFADIEDTADRASLRVKTQLMTFSSRYALVDAYITLSRDMNDSADATASLIGIKSMPPAFQPVLLDRWAALLDLDADDNNRLEVLASITDWREKSVRELLARNQDNNAVRACVAEMRSWLMIGGHKHYSRVVTAEAEIASSVFETMPVASWGPLLAYMAVRNESRAKWIDRPTLLQRTAEFLKCPDAALSYTSVAFSTLLCKCAAQIFNDLPDKAVGPISKYDRFCDRFGIRLQLRDDMKIKVLRGVVAPIPTHAPRLRLAIRRQLDQAGFPDKASFAIVLEERYRLLQSLASET
jgi:hypothetical protein